MLARILSSDIYVRLNIEILKIHYIIEYIIMGFWGQLILLKMVFTKKMEHLREDFMECHLL